MQSQQGPPFLSNIRPTRSGLSRTAGPSSSRFGLRAFLARGTWPLLFSCVIVIFILILPSHGDRKSSGQITTAAESADPPALTRQRQRQLYGKVERKYMKGVTGVHVAAVSGGDESPYPGVNNTQRWQALAASSPYPFTRLGATEAWIGDKGVTSNKLKYYMKWLRTVPPDDVVIILDAHDVLFFPCSRDIVEEFHKLPVDILFGADYNAFPDNDTAAYFPDTPRLQSRWPPQKYLNCGGIIGYSEDIQYYISHYFYGSGRSHEAFKDQRFWTDIFLQQVHKTGAYRGDEPTIGLDYDGKVFQMFRAAPVSDKGCWTMDLKTKAVTAATKCPKLYDDEACILHGPGLSKKTFWFEMLPRWRAANDTDLY